MSDEKIEFDLGAVLINAYGESYFRQTYARYSPMIANLADPVLRKFNRLFPDKSTCPPDLAALIDDYINIINPPVEPIFDKHLDELAKLIKKTHENKPTTDNQLASEDQDTMEGLIQEYIGRVSTILPGGNHNTLNNNWLAEHVRLIQSHKRKILAIKTPSMPLNAESLLTYHRDLTKLIDNYNKELVKINPPKQDDPKRYKRLRELRKLMKEHKLPRDASSPEWMKLIEEYKAELVKLRPPKEASLHYKIDVIMHYLTKVDKLQKEAHAQAVEATISTDPVLPQDSKQITKSHFSDKEEFKKRLRQELLPMLTQKEVLKVLSISRSSLYRGIEDGLYPNSIKVTGKKLARWERESIINALASRMYD